MSNKGLFLKIFGGFGLLVLALSVLTVFFSFSIIRNHYNKRLATELEHLGRAMTPSILRLLDAPAGELEIFLREESRKIEARVTVINPDGVVLADTEINPKTMESHRYRPEVAEALEGKIGRSERFSTTVEDRMMYVGLPLRDAAGAVRGVLRLSLFSRDVEALLADIRGGLFRAILIVTVLALLAALAFAVHWTRPIRALVLASGKVAAGDFRTKVHISRRDEFHALAAGFNAMTARLNDQFEDLTRRKEEVENVFAAIREGLAVLDRDGRLVLSNRAFQDLFQTAAPEGRYYWEAVRSAGLQKLLDRSRTEKTSLYAEIKFGEKHLLAAANYLPFQDRIALVLHDLTERRRLEDIKRDFIVNVSHELRTPLTAISGAVELLEDSAGVTAPGALDILRRHVLRMRSIVEDLLKLGELEAPGVRLDLGDLDLESLARRVADLFTARARDKGLEFKVEAAPRLPMVRADAFQIEQLLINLVDNAVKYTEKGAVVIAVRTEKATAILEVRDSGPGIPEEHRERIFERFYRVDKSRSRILGGTGLGLSIVKHIVQLHGGTIEVRGEEGKGTTFVIRLPLEGAPRV